MGNYKFLLGGVAIILLSSCSGIIGNEDNEDDNTVTPPVPATSGSLIKARISASDGTYMYMDFGYDKEGRVSSISNREEIYDEYPLESEITIEYSPNEVKAGFRTDEDGEISEYSITMHLDASGKATSMANDYNEPAIQISYKGNSLSSIRYGESGSECRFTWTNGNITKSDLDYGDISEYTYTDKSGYKDGIDINYILSLGYDGDLIFPGILGLLGDRCANLVNPVLIYNSENAPEDWSPIKEEDFGKIFTERKTRQDIFDEEAQFKMIFDEKSEKLLEASVENNKYEVEYEITYRYDKIADSRPDEYGYYHNYNKTEIGKRILGKKKLGILFTKYEFIYAQ